MVDPTKITSFDLCQHELEEVLLFWVCAAGKNGVTAARTLESLLAAWRSQQSPFETIRHIDRHVDLAQEMRKAGIGCFNNKAKTFRYLANSGLDLKTCTLEQLESVPGIGPKTARCFLIHSRRDQPYAGLDTHILSFLRDCGEIVPKSTPTGKKYRYIEDKFLQITKMSKKSVADLDLMIWNVYSGRNDDKSSVVFLNKLKIRWIESKRGLEHYDQSIRSLGS